MTAIPTGWWTFMTVIPTCDSISRMLRNVNLSGVPADTACPHAGCFLACIALRMRTSPPRSTTSLLFLSQLCDKFVTAVQPSPCSSGSKGCAAIAHMIAAVPPEEPTWIVTIVNTCTQGERPERGCLFDRETLAPALEWNGSEVRVGHTKYIAAVASSWMYFL